MILGLPYVELPTATVELPLLGPVTLTVFGITAAVAIVVGQRRCIRYAHARDLDVEFAQRLCFWAIVVGLIVAHWVSMLGYYPERVLQDPLSLLAVTGGLSSVGGLAGGLIALVWLTRRAGKSALAYADMLLFGFVAAFCIGRLGCAAVHDHPGALASPDAWLSVGPWPGVEPAHRYDLGLIEFSGCVVLWIVVDRFLARREAGPGKLTAAIALLYAPPRFALDFLRAVDARYLGLTAAQWACVAIFASGVALVLDMRRRARGTVRAR